MFFRKDSRINVHWIKDGPGIFLTTRLLPSEIPRVGDHVIPRGVKEFAFHLLKLGYRDPNCFALEVKKVTWDIMDDVEHRRSVSIVLLDSRDPKQK